MVVPQQQTSSSFAGLLRELRVARGYSQEALAERASLSPRTISDLERGVKTRPHPATMRFLADALELAPDERARLVAASRPGKAATFPPAPPPVHRVPQAPSPLIGRAAELATALDQLSTGGARLLTVTGPGGVGKTRLALEIAGAVEAAGQREVAFVELGPIAKASLVPASVAATLDLHERAGVPLEEAIRERVRSRPLLLALDNCEHVLDGVRPLVADLLAAAPELVVLATSRPPLHLRGEQSLPLAPWPVPEPDDVASLADLDASPAVALFLQRAESARADLALTDADARDIADICRQLDGLPLALELAAIRLRALSVRSLAGLLDERLRLLTQGPFDAPERHRTLREAITWSHDLLTGSQKTFFRRLAVFAGGCTLDAATRVAAGDDPFTALDGLEALVDQGMVLQASEPDGDIRFRMLGTVRDYALERLGESGETGDVHAALAAQVIDLAEQADPTALVARLTREQANIRAALAWALGDIDHGGDSATALRLAAALWPFWHMRGQYQEGHAWLERAIAQAGQVDPAERAQAFLTLANIANNLEDHAHAQSLYEESLRISEKIGNEQGIANALIGLGMVATNTGDYDRAGELLERGLELVRATGGTQAALACLFGLGQLAVARGDYEAADRWFEEARLACEPAQSDILAYLSMEEARIARYRGDLTIAREMTVACLGTFRAIGEQRAEAASLAELGLIAMQDGALDEAATLLGDAAARHLELRDELNVVHCLEGMTSVAAADGRTLLAARLAGAAAAWRYRVGTTARLPDRQAFDHAVATARSAAGGDFEVAWRAGSLMSIEQVLGEMTASPTVAYQGKPSTPAW
jgi:predicted ATPase/DNA-binding XRE family transcriptional regulator